mmetsp:Transcript_5178/g.9848  ORF Transcript_5178/g.9848 Transcript_5178/m.9848 type:complete len:608 (-) Transcript_5178:223-2046(-)|eukprot:CAMPEP_0114229046 /NCGR_PEP_ID=MMETSP0058-20121206/2684_1 /TAXON_ID=36894 /ORGANISM="Pyramimonas parkeae, CCMP726" /LENGTH=607 /DNA_ID=CAMNT_0001340067 /DNA_START=51 /DNA_END=1874 /DNA_ORIENTATION=-
MSLQVVIDKPQYQQSFMGYDGHIKFRLTTHTNISRYCAGARTAIEKGSGVIFTVYRRMSDFVWLSERLQEKYIGLIVPPLPPRRTLSTDILSNFVQHRMLWLNKFLERLCAHKELRVTDELHTFLSERNQDEWELVVNATAEGVLGRMSSMFSSVGIAFNSMSSPHSLDTINSKEDPQYLRVISWVEETEKLTQHLKEDLQVLINRFNSGQNNTVLDKMGSIARKLQSCDAYGTAALILYSGRSQNNTWNVCMERFAEAMYMLSGQSSYETTGSRIYSGILDQIDDRHRAIQVLKVLFQKRKEALLEYTIAEAAVEVELRKQYEMAERVNAGMGELESDLSVMRNKTEAMQQHTAEVVERYQRMVDRMRKELPRFHDETARELGNAFRVCAEMQADLAYQTAETWECILDSANVPNIKKGGKKHRDKSAGTPPLVEAVAQEVSVAASAESRATQPSERDRIRDKAKRRDKANREKRRTKDPADAADSAGATPPPPSPPSAPTATNAPPPPPPPPAPASVPKAEPARNALLESIRNPNNLKQLKKTPTEPSSGGKGKSKGTAPAHPTPAGGALTPPSQNPKPALDFNTQLASKIGARRTTLFSDSESD